MNDSLIGRIEQRHQQTISNRVCRSRSWYLENETAIDEANIVNSRRAAPITNNRIPECEIGVNIFIVQIHYAVRDSDSDDDVPATVYVLVIR